MTQHQPDVNDPNVMHACFIGVMVAKSGRPRHNQYSHEEENMLKDGSESGRTGMKQKG